jgi:DNA polymerase-3 subunit beta
VDGRVVVHTDEGWIRLVSGASQANFSTFPHEEFPRLLENDDIETFSIPKRHLKEMIELTQFSISNDEARPALNGAYFKVSKSADASGLHLALVTTDGHRLSKVERDIPDISYSQTPADGIIHKKGILELKRTMDGPDDSVEIGFVGKKEIVFKNDGGTLKVRQVDAKYPNYEKVIPTTCENKISIPRDSFLHGLRLSSSITGTKTSLVKLNFEAGKLLIVGTNPDLGEGKAETPIDFSGSPITIGFNSRYLLDIANVVREDQFLMEFTDSGSQALIRSPKDLGALYVVMPMRV